MPNLLLLCEYATLSGGERSMLSTLASVRTAGFIPAVIAPPNGPLADVLRDRDVELLPFAPLDAQGNRWPLGRAREELAELLRHRRPDLLHANSLSMGRLSGPVAAEARVPAIAHLRDIIKLSRQAISDLNRLARLLAVSEATRAFHAAAGLTPEKIHVLHNGVHLQRFCPRTPTGYLHRELGIRPSAPLIGTIGQICLRKAQDVLVRAAKTVCRRLADAHWLVVGERFSRKEESRRFEDELRAAAATRPLAGRLHLLGTRDDVPRILNELTLLAHPSRQEPLGRVLLEAAASGVAVVATDVGGTGEIFPSASEAARLVPPDDAGALAEAIEQLLADGAHRRRLAAAARRRAEEAFDLSPATDGLIHHYQELM